MKARSNLWQTAALSLVTSFGSACGSQAAPTSRNGAVNGASTMDGVAGSMDDGSTTDSAGAMDGGSATDGAGPAGNEGPADVLEAGNAADVGGQGSTAPVNLRTAGFYAVLAKSGISSVPVSHITGNIAVSPVAATAITGFSLTAGVSGVSATSPQVTGLVYAADYTAPTPSNLTTAIGDMILAFTDAAGRAPMVTELGAGNIGGMTLAPGVYKWGTGLLIPTELTLNGSATDVWVFQVAQDLDLAAASQVVLTGGAVPKNVFWQVAGLVVLGTTAHLEGVILTKTSVAMLTGASITGRLFAQTAVTIQGSTIVQPAM
jgi:hypothetical protein